jgi:hypothetical protein
MLNQNIPQRQSLRAAKLTRIERQETDREIRESLQSGSATNFVTSRLVRRLENGLFGGAK